MDWRAWLRVFFPEATWAPFSERHVRLWEWFESLEPGVSPRPRVECWPRGGAKSSSVELAATRLAVTLRRRFFLYVSETQKQADDHVQTIASQLERAGIDRALNRYGVSRGWTGSRLRAAGGFNVQALGLDAATRGIKFDQWRPDLIALDDVDGRHDTEDARLKKVDIITTSLLPAGSPDCAVIFLQNKIYADSIVSQLMDGRADFLHNRVVSPVEVAVRNLRYERVPAASASELPTYRVTGGEPTWEGQSLAVAESQINLWGITAFLREAQQEVEDEEGGLWSRVTFEQTRVFERPELHRICVAVDPNATEGGDEAGITVAGVARLGGTPLNPGVLHGYLLEDCTIDGGPKRWAEAAVAAYHRHRADVLVAEKNNGGEMVRITIQTVKGAPPVRLIHASRGKITRAEPVQKLYDDGRFHHVGHFQKLEKECCVYRPGMPSPNRMDSLVWNATELLLGPGQNKVERPVGRQRAHLGYS